MLAHTVTAMQIESNALGRHLTEGMYIENKAGAVLSSRSPMMQLHGDGCLTLTGSAVEINPPIVNHASEGI